MGLSIVWEQAGRSSHSRQWGDRARAVRAREELEGAQGFSKDAMGRSPCTLTASHIAYPRLPGASFQAFLWLCGSLSAQAVSSPEVPGI